DRRGRRFRREVARDRESRRRRIGKSRLGNYSARGEAARADRCRRILLLLELRLSVPFGGSCQVEVSEVWKHQSAAESGFPMCPMQSTCRSRNGKLPELRHERSRARRAIPGGLRWTRPIAPSRKSSRSCGLEASRNSHSSRGILG